MNRPDAIGRPTGKFSALFKAVFICGLILVLLVPLLMIGSLTSERERRRDAVEAEIFQARGGEQRLGGPILVVPYVLRSADAGGPGVETVEQAFFMPESLTVTGAVAAEPRRRGIFEVIVYTTDLALSGTFAPPDFSGWRVPPEDILWDSAVLSVEMRDLRSIQVVSDLSWAGRHAAFRSGRPAAGLLPGAIQAPVAGLGASTGGARAAGARTAGARIPFSFSVSLCGGGSLSFLPVADQTTVRLTSAWQSPSFSGAFLPAERTVGAEGFTALWKVPALARSFPQRWQSGQTDTQTLTVASFGVALTPVVEAYQKVTRSLKYGALFLLLPFLVFFLFEILGGRMVHPLPYLFVGLAECLFYLLLLSLAEHMPFLVAYVAAAAASVAMVTLYASAVLSGWKRGLALLPLLAAAYGFLYATLQSEDGALLIGAAGLFLILGGVMFLTRKVDWYCAGKAG